MKTTLIIMMLCLTASIFALTGFGESAVFEITGETLPVQLSSFTAIATQSNFIQLDWITQSETGVSGYYIYRNTANSLDNAEVVSPFITAGNTSQEQSYSYIDREVTPGTWYYWLQNIDLNGQVTFHGSINVTLSDNNDNNGTPVIPTLSYLSAIYPNPFNPVTTISFGLAKSEQVSLGIYNIRGEKVRTVESKNLNSGTYLRTWNGTDDAGSSLPRGVYFLKMTAGEYTSTQKMVLLN